MSDIDGRVQYCSMSNTLEILQYCTKPLIWFIFWSWKCKHINYDACNNSVIYSYTIMIIIMKYEKNFNGNTWYIIVCVAIEIRFNKTTLYIYIWLIARPLYLATVSAMEILQSCTKPLICNRWVTWYYTIIIHLQIKEHHLHWLTTRLLYIQCINNEGTAVLY